MSWRIDPSSASFLAIDLQERLLPVIANREQVVQKTGLMLKIARLFTLPIFVTEQVPEKLGSTIKEIADLAAVPARTKTDLSALPALSSGYLSETWILAGIETHVCVRQTALDLLDRKFRVYVLADATGSRNENDHRLALEEFRATGIQVVSVEALAWELIGSATHPKFREALQILK